MTKIVLKYSTGQDVPDGAVYLCTKIQTRIEGVGGKFVDCWLVWHYFMLEVNRDKEE